MRGNREDQVASVMLDRLAAEPPPPPTLVALDPTLRLRRAVEDAIAWQRFASDGEPDALPWPGSRPAASAILRLPKGRAALRMCLHALASRLPAGAPLWLYGANDEGIRSSGKELQALFDGVATLEARRHCRIWRGRRSGTPARGSLDAWEEPFLADLPDGVARVVSYPGLFAHGHLDAGTRLLVGAVTKLPPGAHVLDFGCGAGLVALATAQREPSLRLTLLDHDALALHAAAQNVPDAAHVLGNSLESLPAGARFDAILSNPPFHQGKPETAHVLHGLVEGASRRLTRRGKLWVVAQRRFPMGTWLEKHFQQVQCRAQDRSFRVWHAARPEDSSGDPL